MKYGLFGNFVATDGNRDELLNILLEASELLKANSDCVHYVVSTSGEPNTVWVYETWTDKAAHDKALEPENIQSLIQRAMPFVAGMSTQNELSVQGGKGI